MHQLHGQGLILRGRRLQDYKAAVQYYQHSKYKAKLLHRVLHRQLPLRTLHALLRQLLYQIDYSGNSYNYYKANMLKISFYFVLNLYYCNIFDMISMAEHIKRLYRLNRTPNIAKDFQISGKCCRIAADINYIFIRKTAGFF